MSGYCKKTSLLRFFAMTAVLAMVLAACAPKASPAPALTATQAAPRPTRQPTGTLTAEPTLAASETSTPNPTKTPDLRLPPEKWREWPEVPAVTARARQIYQQGLALGNNPHRFSKVGDCQSIKSVMLGIYDLPDQYRLTDEQAGLQKTINWFEGSFNRDGMAVQGGFNAASVLSPLWANPDICQAGENPLECEVHYYRPGIAFISLEVWWQGRTPASYEKNLRKVIDYLIGKGVVPVLSTKADNVEGDHSINLVNARLAYEYDLPLWNFWRAAQHLSNRGLDPSRPDGFHLSVDAWNERSLTALQTLDSIWNGVRDLAGQVTPSPVPTLGAEVELAPATAVPLPSLEPAATAETTPAATPEPGAPAAKTVTSAPMGGQAVFGLAQRKDEKTTYLGVYRVDLKTGERKEVAGAGYNLQELSPDGRQVLINQGADLYLAQLDGSNPVKLASNFSTRGRHGAMWLDRQAILFIANQGANNLLVYYPLDGSGWRRLTPAGDNPLEIYPSPETKKVYWENGTCDSSGACTNTGVRATTLDGLYTDYLSNILRPAFSADGRYLAYVFYEYGLENVPNLIIRDLQTGTDRKIKDMGDHLMDYAWSPDGKNLSLLALTRSEYSGRWFDIRNLVITPPDMGTKIHPPVSGQNIRTVWAPDGRSLLITGTGETKDGYQINLGVLNRAADKLTTLDEAVNLASPEFILVTNIFWAPE